jgi:DNA-binding NtrC family response regulator
MIHRSSHTVLLVDDDPDCLDAINQILRRDGYGTIPTSNGKEAINALKVNSIDLAVVDFNMPDMNGLQVIREIKNIKHNLPVILVTAEPSEKLRVESIKFGAYSLLTKPINIPNFRQTILKAIQSPALRTVELRRSMVFIRWIKRITNR